MMIELTYHQGEDEVPSLKEHFALGESGALPTGHLGHCMGNHSTGRIPINDVYPNDKFMNTH